MTQDLAGPLNHYIWAPLPLRHREQVLFRLLSQTRPLPDPFRPFSDHGGHFVFYTDGSADFANQPTLRRAAFGVIQDVTSGDCGFEEKVSLLSQSNSIPFRVVSMSMCPNKQSVARAELAAVAHVAESMTKHHPGMKYTVHSDAQYAVDAVVQCVTDDDQLTMDHHTANNWTLFNVCELTGMMIWVRLLK